MWRRAAAILFSSSHALSESCWSAGYSAELCCDTETFGPGGNAVCWDGSDFTYQRCCCGPEGLCYVRPLQEAAWGAWAEPLLGNPVEELSLGLFPTYEPGKDCWTGSAATYAKCCDLSMNPMGNIWNCWDNERFTFERCCFLGEAAPGAAPPKPLLRPALNAPLPGTTAPPLKEPPELAILRPAGRECWVQGFTFASCCLAGITSCWDDIFTYSACCENRPPMPQVGAIAAMDDPTVECLELASLLTFDLEQRPRQCPQRYFYLASAGTALIGPDRKGLPWWYRTDDLQMVKPLRPQRMHFVGGICVPNTCSTEAVARYLAPLVVPWWRSPRPKARLWNASHLTLPPPLAVPHKAFRLAGNESYQVWTALRPPEGEVMADLDRWDFAILQYRARGKLSNAKAMLVWTAFGIILVFGSLPRGVEIDNFLSPSFHLLRLGTARGPKHLEIARLVLTMAVLLIHVSDHGPWTPVQQHSCAAYLMLLRSCMSRVNIGFVVLLVHLSISRRTLKQATSLWGWIKGMIFHALKRLLVIAPVVGTWSLVFVQAPFHDVPMNNILKSNPLYLWYGERRDQCENTFQLVCSVLLIHAPVMGMRSPCHNTDIFESLFQVDLLIYALLSALGRARAAQLSHFLWVAAVLLSYSQMSSSEQASFNDTCHTFASLLPSALATLAMSTWLPKPELPMALRRGRERGHAGMACVAVLGVLITCLQDGMLHSSFHWPACFQQLVDFVKQTHALGRDYVLPCHCWELLLVFSLLVLLKQGWLTPPRQEGWSAFRALARMSTGICVSNLFVLHAMGAFFYEEPVDLNIFSFMAHFLVTLILSLLASIVVHILIEGPFACLLTDGLPQDTTAFPAAAAAA